MDYFTPLIGQKQAIALLTQAVTQNRIAPAYLFTGPVGVGKSLAARCFIEQVFCANFTTPVKPEYLESLQNRLRQGNHPDLLWIQPTYLHQGQRLSATEAAAVGLKRKAPPVIRTEQIREIEQFLSRSPLLAPRLIIVLDQAETMPEAAANALLKTLEEPGKATLILIAPSSESLLPTLVSRCQRIPFYRLDQQQMAQVLQPHGYKEILHLAPTLLAIAQGSPGEAITRWKQLQAIPKELLQAVSQLPPTVRAALDLARQIDKSLDTESQLLLVDYLQQCFWQQFLAGKIYKSPIEQLEKARQSLLAYAQPRLVWEVTLLRMTE